MILNPLMVEFGGIDPAVSSATSGLMVLFASASATAFFIVEDRLNLHFALAFGCSCLLCTFMASKILLGVVKKHGVSLMMFIVSFVIGCGCVLTVVLDGGDAWRHWRSGDDGFKEFCI